MFEEDEVIAEHEYNQIQQIKAELNRLIERLGLLGYSLKNRPKIICLCGSSRYCCEIALKKWELEKQGHIAIGMHLLPANYTDIPHHLAEAEGVAHILDEVHLRKIDIADEVFVVNPGGYIGERTKIEIEYAEAQGKPIACLEPIGE